MRAKEKHKARKDIGSWGRTLAGMARKRLKEPRKCAGHSSTEHSGPTGGNTKRPAWGREE